MANFLNFGDQFNNQIVPSNYNLLYFMVTSKELEEMERNLEAHSDKYYYDLFLLKDR